MINLYENGSQNDDISVTNHTLSEQSSIMPKIGKKQNRSYFGSQFSRKNAEIQANLLKKTQEKLNKSINKNINLLKISNK